jgi:hypothetical protein
LCGRRRIFRAAGEQDASQEQSAPNHNQAAACQKRHARAAAATFRRRFRQWFTALRANEIAIHRNLQILLAARERTVKIVCATAATESHARSYLVCWFGRMRAALDKLMSGSLKIRNERGSNFQNASNSVSITATHGRNGFPFTRHGCAALLKFASPRRLINVIMTAGQYLRFLWIAL